MPSEAPSGKPVPDNIETQLLAVFHAEGRLLLQRLHDAIADGQSHPADHETRRRIARLLHSLKGCALAAGIAPLAEHVHRLEDSLADFSPHLLKAGLDQAGAMLGSLPAPARDGTAAPDNAPLRLDSLKPRLQRLAVQTAETLGKRAALEIHNGASAIRRASLERLAAPLEHLVCNAVLHGIETPSQRHAVGKEECGLIRLSAEHTGSELILSLEDDGAGLDFPAIRAHARKHGLLPPETGADEDQLARLIFLPGFSTAELSPLAGRGIGMSIVEAETAALGGRVECDSLPGLGTRICLSLPASAV